MRETGVDAARPPGSALTGNGALLRSSRNRSPWPARGAMALSCEETLPENVYCLFLFWWWWWMVWLVAVEIVR